MRRAGSVGLGGNISRSLRTMRAGDDVTTRFNAEGEDAGNGSLMRLAPVPIAYRLDARAAAAAAAESSYTTHPGPMAAEACAFLATLCVRAMTEFEPAQQAESARAFLIRVADEHAASELAPPAATDAARRGTAELRRLLLSSEPQGGLETCWNWRDAHLDVSGTLKRRGRQYNGYPVSAGYFGSFCLDGLAIALHAVAATASFSAAIERCVNFLGDADSTAAICGQILATRHQLWPGPTRHQTVAGPAGRQRACFPRRQILPAPPAWCGAEQAAAAAAVAVAAAGGRELSCCCNERCFSACASYPNFSNHGGMKHHLL